MLKTRILAFAMVLGTVAVSSASWVKWADINTGVTAGSAIPLSSSGLTWVPTAEPVFGHSDQFFLEISAANDLTAWDATWPSGVLTPVVAGSNFQWTLNNFYGGSVKASLLRGMSASNGVDQTLLSSDGYLHWHGQGSAKPNTALTSWGFTGNFRLVEGVPGQTLRFEAEMSDPAVPGPAAAIPFAVGLLAAAKRRRK